MVGSLIAKSFESFPGDLQKKLKEVLELLFISASFISPQNLIVAQPSLHTAQGEIIS